MRQLFKDAQHLFRMAGFFVIGATTFFVLRAILLPADFGTYGHYRAGAIADNASERPIHAGRQVCEVCHDAVVEARVGGRHQRIGCETCHGAAAIHAADPSIPPGEVPNITSLCTNCHSRLAARPKTFPQVDVEEHFDGASCEACHAPHNPGFG